MNKGTVSHRSASIRLSKLLELSMAQDFHLAKRHYDIALETNVEAYLPVTLSLFRLHARSIWYILTGRDGGRLWSRDADHGKLCVSDILLERHPSISQSSLIKTPRGRNWRKALASAVAQHPASQTKI